MAIVPYQVQGLSAQQADGNILLSWTGSLGALTYQVNRSTDGVNYTSLATLGLVNQYVDALPGVGIVYYYQVAAINGAGTGPYSSSVQMVAAPPGEMSLGELRLRSQQTADRVNSTFVTPSEWNAFIRLAMDEFYDILIGSYQSYMTSFVLLNTNGVTPTQQYPLPSGINYLGGVLGGMTGVPAPRLYKLTGVDLGVNTSNNAWVTLHTFNWEQRNSYVYPNSTSTIYGVYNMRYRQMGTNLYIIPAPAGNQQLRLSYSPVLPALLADNDMTNIGYSGWLRYPIVRAAKYALNKEEQPTPELDSEILFLNKRIIEAAASRDEGQADTITDSRRDPLYGNTGWGQGSQGGW